MVAPMTMMKVLQINGPFFHHHFILNNAYDTNINKVRPTGGLFPRGATPVASPTLQCIPCLRASGEPIGVDAQLGFVRLNEWSVCAHVAYTGASDLMSGLSMQQENAEWRAYHATCYERF